MTATSKMRLAEARVLFINRIKALGYAETTTRVYNGMLGRLVRDLGDLQLQNINKTHVEDWLLSLRTEHRTDQWGRATNPGIGTATYNQHVSNLRQFFKWAQAQGHMRHNPTVDLRLMKIERKTRQQPSAVVLSHLLETADFPRDRALLALGMNTGLRASEITSLHVGDVDLESGNLYATIHKTKEADVMPITADLDRELRRWFVAYAENIGRPLASDDYLVPSAHAPLIQNRGPKGLVFGPRVLRPGSPMPRTEKVVQAALKAVGLPTKGEGIHTLRRAVAREYFEQVSRNQGDVAALRETAQLLHHSNLHTTERYLGMSAEKHRRDQRMRGKPFITAMISQENVVPMRRATA